MRLTGNSNRRILEVEELESRLALDGSVSAVLNHDGDLIVRGDNAANFLTISRPGGPGSPVQVQGVNGTAINGVIDGVAVIGSVLHVDVKLGAGDDAVLLDSVDAPGIVRVALGEGDDFATFDGVVGGAVELEGGEGNDGIEFSKDSEVFVYVQLRTGEGDDSIFFRNTAIGGRLEILTGQGNDYLDLFHVAVAEGATIETGEGDDQLILESVTVAGDTTINLGAGDDALYVVDSAFSGPFFANGGPGTDDIEDDGGNTFADVLFQGFES